jgi:dolichol-phosphate mannosyltransferase
MYNEESIAEASVKEILGYAKRLPGTATLLAVNDGSTDRTESILQRLAPIYDEKDYRFISAPVNKGYGGALKLGIGFAIENDYDYVLFMDSDLTNHPRYLKDFYDKMCEGYDYIKASRYIKYGGTSGVPFKRRLISMAGNVFAKIVTRLPLKDFSNGFRAVKVSIIKKIELKENSYALIIEELKKVSKITHNFCEIPCILETRSKIAGSSKFNYSFKTFWNYVKYLFI